MPGVGGPERRRRHVDVGRDFLGDFPGRLCQRQPQRLDVDESVREPLRHRLETADRPVELFTGAGVVGGESQSAIENAELLCGAAQG